MVCTAWPTSNKRCREVVDTTINRPVFSVESFSVTTRRATLAITDDHQTTMMKQMNEVFRNVKTVVIRKRLQRSAGTATKSSMVMLFSSMLKQTRERERPHLYFLPPAGRSEDVISHMSHLAKL